MDDTHIGQQLHRVARQAVPDDLDLWPAVHAELNQRPATAARPTHHRTSRSGSIAAVALAVVLLLVVAVPDVRRAAAEGLAYMERLVTSISAGSQGITELRPLPPFTARQLGALPPSFTLASTSYNPGPQQGQNPPAALGGWRIESSTTNQPDPEQFIREALRRDRGPDAYLLLVYASPTPEYVMLFQRLARSGEPLPAGEPRIVANQPASFQNRTPLRQLTWVEGNTWYELESTLSEAEMLQLATNLVPLNSQTAEAANGQESQTVSATVLSEKAWCDPTQRPPMGFMIEPIPDAQLRGLLTIRLGQSAEHDTLGEWTSYVPDGVTGVLQPALAALRDPNVPMVPVSYVLDHTLDETEHCLRPSSNAASFIVVDVWDGQVNIGYGGEGASLRERAAAALERAIQAQR